MYRTIQGLFVIALVYLVYKAFRTDDEDVLRFRMRVGAVLAAVVFCLINFFMKMSKPKGD
ncbi:hypothetical protein FOL46_000694 [Perkinsus olseni]|uniref:Uncharacterized protein n=1 Tax=Perkinsus olseni TaxID=32597 RepID=A0A7J6KVA6_PEROL|nr:hypothetical protein FOL46_000694 [Perkinsus olseni]